MYHGFSNSKPQGELTKCWHGESISMHLLPMVFDWAKHWKWTEQVETSICVIDFVCWWGCIINHANSFWEAHDTASNVMGNSYWFQSHHKGILQQAWPLIAILAKVNLQSYFVWPPPEQFAVMLKQGPTKQEPATCILANFVSQAARFVSTIYCW